MPRRAPLTVALLSLLVPSGGVFAAEFEVSPGDNFCQVFNQEAGPGDEVVLLPGMHAGPCNLSTGGVEGSAKVLRAQDPEQLTAIVYDGNSSNVLDVNASDIVIDGLSFGPTNPAIDAIKVKTGDRVAIRRSHFFQVGGISVAANTSDTAGLEIVGNFFEDLKATGIYIGCQNGEEQCVATDVLIAENLIVGVESAAVGYGLEIKLDSYGVVRDNVIDDTKGPGIEIYGSPDLSRRSLVEGNIVGGSRESSSLEIGGGPALVRNNVVLGGSYAALRVYDYNGWGNVHDIQLLGNTVIGDEGPAIRLGAWVEGKSLELTGNAAWQEAGMGPAIPEAVPGVVTAGNVDCSVPAQCWVDGASRDLWPVDGGSLLSMGAAPTLAALEDDFCGNPRGVVPHVGALEQVGDLGPGPLAVDFKSAIACPVEGGETTGGESTGGETTGGETSGGETSGTTSGSGGETGETAGGTGASGDASAGSSGGSTGADTTSTEGPGTDAASASATGADGAEDDEGCACRSAAEGGRGGPAILVWGLLGLALRRRPSAAG